MRLQDLQAALSARYTIERELGSGGMAVVYLARDLKHNRQVAIKVLRPELAAQLGVERFLKEIELTASLQHPHILQLHDSGEAGGFLFQVVTYVEGESLRTKLNREKQLSLGESVAIVVRVASALDFAHRGGVIHRDIKPENILLQDGQPVVADFGIALAVSAATDTDRLTETGLSLGTPAYMSPEQATAERDVDARTDIYSLGCVLYEMLAGEPPFTGTTARAILAKHALERVPSIRVTRESVPPVVEQVVLRALAKTPADRFTSARQFSEALSEAVATVDSAERRRVPGTRSRQRALWIAGSMIVVLLVIGGVLLGPRSDAVDRVQLSLQPLDHRRIGVTYLEGRDSPQLDYLADALTNEIVDMLSRVEPLSVIPLSAMQEFRGREVPLDSLVRKLRVGTVIGGSVLQVGGRVRVTLRLTDAVNVRQVGSKTLDAPLGEPLGLRNELADSVQQFLREWVGPEVSVLVRRAGTDSDEAWTFLQRAERQRTVAQSLRLAGDLDGGGVALATADSLLRRAASLDREWAEPLVMRGWAALDRADLLVARARTQGVPVATEVQRALETAIDLGGRAVRVAPADPRALELRGAARFRLYDPPLPLEVPDRSALLELAERDLRAAIATHPWPARALSTLSDVLRRREVLDEARAFAERAIEADPFLACMVDCIGDLNSLAGNSARRLAQVLLDGDRPEEAAELCADWTDRDPSPQWPLCELIAVATAGTGADSVWPLAREMVARSQPETQSRYRAQGRMLVSMVLAQRGLVDSGTGVLERTLADGPSDEPRLAYYEAAAQLALGHDTKALDALRRLFASHPQFRAIVARDVFFRRLWNDRDFQELVGLTR
ncbi:MAG TPA: protein kinase [Gemmatimonadales bacterium]|jgi:serine/threonine-protein kinase